MDRDLDPVEIRVLGCLIEKQRTTPDQYPLSLNALRNACNQTTNRFPVVSWDEDMLRPALQKLGRRRYTRLTSGHSSRAGQVPPPARRGDPARRGRAGRARGAVPARRPDPRRAQAAHGADGADEHRGGAGRAHRPDRQGHRGRARPPPGQKEERFRHRLSDDLDPSDIPEGVDAPAPAAAVIVPPPPRRDERVDKLEGEVAALRAELDALRAEFAALREELGA